MENRRPAGLESDGVSAEEPPKTTFKTLLRRIWGSVLAHKSLVVSILLLAALEAFFSKAPLVLVKPLGNALTGAARSPGAAPGALSFGDRFNEWFQGMADSLVRWLGISFDGPSAQAMNSVTACAILAVAAGVLGGFCIYGLQILARYFAIKIVVDLRNEVVAHVLRLPLRYFGGSRMGELISKITNDAQVLQRSFELACDNVVVDPLMILANVAILAWFVPEAILILVLMVPVMAIPMYRHGRRVRRRSHRSLEAMGDATESMNQILSGIRTVKSFQLEEERLREYEANNRNFMGRTVRMLRAKAMSMAQTFVAYQIGFAVLLLLLGWIVLVRGDLRFEDVALVIAPLTTTYQHVKRLTRSYNTLMESVGALEGIERILNAKPDPTVVGGKPLAELKGGVRIEDLYFGYRDEPVLRGIDIDVAPGQTIALVGPSGGGKSTLLDLLMRFFDPDQGRILIDGVDLREIRLADYRRQTAVVSQSPFLFNTSIRENIACGRPGATMEEIEKAARAANIHDFIVSLPDGYETKAGERGCNLSGGQMQRIAIARALVRDPAILFLDEATSALDSENEELVQRALDNLRKGRTSFVIAHRLSTISNADRIVVLVEGRIVEAGTHEELLRAGGLYKRMRELQS
ncbi:MAG: ABC transporter ATP-binding protein [Planctomycetota bacterium]